jgi:hypothetical protein
MHMTQSHLIESPSTLCQMAILAAFQISKPGINEADPSRFTEADPLSLIPSTLHIFGRLFLLLFTCNSPFTFSVHSSFSLQIIFSHFDFPS